MPPSPHERSRLLRRHYAAFACGFILGAAMMASPVIAALIALVMGADLARRAMKAPGE